MTAEIVNWTGHLLLAPRPRLAEILNRPEVGRTGVYFLFSEFLELGGRRPVYIGESDDVGRRIGEHARDPDRDFEHFCLVTSKDMNLTKAHARFLENRFTTIAKASGRAMVQNGLQPSAGTLPESDLADMEYFIEQVRLLLPVLGYEVLKEPFNERTEAAKVDHDDFSGAREIRLHLRPSRIGLRAEAIEREGEMILLAGSLAVATPDFAVNQYGPLRDRLIAEGTLLPTEDGTFLSFGVDTLFASPSAAAAVIYGRNANGRTSWLVAGTNQTLKDFQNERLPKL